MSTFRRIDVRLWNDPKVRPLPPESKLVFLYLITTPQGHVSGVYFFSLTHAARDLGLETEAVWAALAACEKAGLIVFDMKNEVVFVRSMLKLQGSGDKVKICARSHAETFPQESRCVHALAERYPELEIDLKNTPCDTLSDRVSHGVSGVQSRASASQHSAFSVQHAASSISPPLRDVVTVEPSASVNPSEPIIDELFLPDLPETVTTPTGRTETRSELSVSPTLRGPLSKTAKAAIPPAAPTRDLVDEWSKLSTANGYGVPAKMGRYAGVLADLWHRSGQDRGACVAALANFFADRDQIVVESGHDVGWFQKKMGRYLADAKGMIHGVASNAERAFQRNAATTESRANDAASAAATLAAFGRPVNSQQKRLS